MISSICQFIINKAHICDSGAPSSRYETLLGESSKHHGIISVYQSKIIFEYGSADLKNEQTSQPIQKATKHGKIRTPKNNEQFHKSFTFEEVLSVEIMNVRGSSVCVVHNKLFSDVVIFGLPLPFQRSIFKSWLDYHISKSFGYSKSEQSISFSQSHICAEYYKEVLSNFQSIVNNRVSSAHVPDLWLLLTEIEEEVRTDIHFKERVFLSRDLLLGLLCLYDRAVHYPLSSDDTFYWINSKADIAFIEKQRSRCRNIESEFVQKQILNRLVTIEMVLKILQCLFLRSSCLVAKDWAFGEDSGPLSLQRWAYLLSIDLTGKMSSLSNVDDLSARKFKEKETDRVDLLVSIRLYESLSTSMLFSEKNIHSTKLINCEKLQLSLMNELFELSLCSLTRPRTIFSSSILHLENWECLIERMVIFIWKQFDAAIEAVSVEVMPFDLTRVDPRLKLNHGLNNSGHLRGIAGHEMKSNRSTADTIFNRNSQDSFEVPLLAVISLLKGVIDDSARIREYFLFEFGSSWHSVAQILQDIILALRSLNIAQCNHHNDVLLNATEQFCRKIDFFVKEVSNTLSY